MMTANAYLEHQFVPRNVKKRDVALNESPRSGKRTKVLLEDNADEDTHSKKPITSENALTDVNEHVLSVNQDFARRFEHNKRREELQQRQFKHDRYRIQSQLTVT